MEKGEIPSTKEARRTEAYPRRHVVVVVSRRYYSMRFLERNDPPPSPVKTLLLLCVCVSTDRTTRLLISLSFDRNFSRNKLSSVWKNSAKNPTLWFCTNAWRCVAFSLSSPRERRSNSNVIIENSKRCSSLPSKGFKARERLQLRELELKNVRGSEHW